VAPPLTGLPTRLLSDESVFLINQSNNVHKNLSSQAINFFGRVNRAINFIIAR